MYRHTMELSKYLTIYLSKPQEEMSYSITPRVLFEPRAIPGCCLWLDAADTSTLTTSGASVTQWRDKSGNANHASNTSAYPTLLTSAQNGRSVLSFDGASSQNLTLSTTSLPTGTTQCSFYFVCRATATSTRMIFSYGVNPGATNRTPQFYFTNGTLNVDTYGAGGLSDGINVQDSYTVLSCTLTNSNIAWTNGTQFTGGSTAITLNTGTGYASIGLGLVGSTPSFPFTGQIAEIIIYNQPATTSQRQQLEGYLAWKWGIQSSLAGGHPYQTVPAYASQPFPLTQGPTSLAGQSLTLPTVIPGCQLWLDASDAATVVLSGTNVTNWNDKSGSSNNATTLTGTLSYASNGIVFTGSQLMTTPLSSVLTSQTIFAIGSASTSSYMDILGVNSLSINNGIQVIVANYNQLVTTYGGTTIVNGTGVGTNTRFLYGLTFISGGQSFVYLNGSQSGSNVSSPSISGTGTVAIGGYRNNASQELYNGPINEIIIYNTILTAVQRQQMEGYLAWKWGLQGNLPSNHPYKSTPPYALPPFPTVTSIPRTLAPTVFSPLSLTPQLWLDGSDRASMVFSSGNNVSTWNDKSGLLRHATATGTISNVTVFNGRFAMSFGGSFSTYFSGVAVNTGNTLTAFVTATMNSASYPSARILSLATTGGTDFGTVLHTAAIERFASGINAYRNMANMSGGAYTFGSPAVFCSQYDGTRHTFFTNGVQFAPVASSGNFGFSNYEVGGSTGEENLVNFNGYVGEVILFNASLSRQDRLAVEGYLAWKWGLQANLPASHPYKNFPPI